MAKGLTKRREMFLEGLMQGKSQRQSYIAAYPNAAKWAPEAVDAKASNLLKTDKVWIRYTELQAAAAAGSHEGDDSQVAESAPGAQSAGGSGAGSAAGAAAAAAGSQAAAAAAGSHAAVVQPDAANV